MDKEYIERNALIHNMQHPKIETNDGQDFADWYSHCVRCAPTIDVAPVMHGRWIEDDDGDGQHCSECGMDYCYMVCDVEKYRYCPNCGAKMERERKCD